MNKKKLSSESFFLLTNESIRLLLYSELEPLYSSGCTAPERLALFYALSISFFDLLLSIRFCRGCGEYIE